jgi:hypothetical protein
VSIDQLKTQFVDTGKISDSEFTEIIDASGAKSAYATWLTKQFINKTIKAEDLYKYNTYFKIFDRRKREYQFQDINQYKTAEDITKFIQKSVELYDRENNDPSQQKGVSRSDKYKEFYIGSTDGFNVYELPKGRTDLYGTSCELGSGAEWCTATGKTRIHFDRYITKGPLFIFIKPGSDEKYQFSYEEQQFMDKNDNSIISPKFDNSIDTNILNLFNFIISKRPKYRVPLKFKLIHNLESFTKDDLNIEGDLTLSNTKITSLPDGLTVTGYLDLTNTPITSLPNNLTVGAGLTLTDTLITSLPNDLTVGGFLRLRDTNIKSLPDGLTVPGYLDLTDSQITSLPNNLTVGQTLFLTSNNIKSLPSGLKVGGSLHLKDTPISKKYSENEIHKMIQDKGGNVKERIWI